MTNRQAAIEVVTILQRDGFEALLAGGCVRDMLLRRRAKDYDVATSALPREVSSLFRRTIQVGAKFGVVIVLIRGCQVEVATFRSEADYSDGRHPDSVRFTSAQEDASRRDFTINGMFYDPVKDETIDYVGGRADIEKGILRTIGDATERFSEDYLRLLRAVRFSARLEFKIHPGTYSAICENAHKITGISGERISLEIEAILTHPNRAQGVDMLVDTGLASVIFDEVTDEQFAEAVVVLGRLREKLDYPLGLAALFVGCTVDTALQQCQTLKLSNNHTKHLQFLLGNRGRLLESDMSLSQLRLIAAEPYFWDLYEFQLAIQKAGGGGHKALEPLGVIRDRVEALDGMELRPKPLLNGHSLLKLGAATGPPLGQLTEEMYIAQLEGIIKTRIEAKQWVTAWIEKHKGLQ